MKKTKYVILFIALLLLVVSVTRKKVNTTTDYLSEIKSLNIEKPTSLGIKKYSIDFKNCDPKDSFKTIETSNTVKFDILGKEETDCLVNTTFETPIGSYTNTCKVPIASGMIAFEGTNFDKITKFCTLNTDNSELLNLN